MIYIVGAVLIVLVLLLLLAGAVIFQLLKRLDTSNSSFRTAADETMKQAISMQKAGPRQLEAMLSSLASATERIHQTIESTVKAVLAPPPVQIDGGVAGMQYSMPTMTEDKDDPQPWDHTDKLTASSMQGPPVGPVGYTHELDEDFDPLNPFGIPGMISDPPLVV